MRRFKRIGYLLAVNLLLILFCSIQALVVSAQNKPMDVKENISENKMEEVDPEIYEKNFRAMTAAELTSGKHRYDNGIYDGAVYYLKNFKQGKYLDLKGGSNANGTSVVTSAYEDILQYVMYRENYAYWGDEKRLSLSSHAFHTRSSGEGFAVNYAILLRNVMELL